jgi:hypothetical protein
VWQQRNTTAHPPTESQNKPNHGRKRKPDQITESESDDSDNGVWVKQRDRSLRELAAWHTGTAFTKQTPSESLRKLTYPRLNTKKAHRRPMEAKSREYTTSHIGVDGEGDSEEESKEASSSDGTTETECSSGSSQDSHSSPAHNMARRATLIHTTTPSCHSHHKQQIRHLPSHNALLQALEKTTAKQSQTITAQRGGFAPPPLGTVE